MNKKGNLIISGGKDMRMVIWDMIEHKIKWEYKLKKEEGTMISSVEFSQDENNIICGTDLGKIWAFSLKSLKKNEFEGRHSKAITQIKVHSSNRIIASSSEDFTIILWDFSNNYGKILSRLNGHIHIVNAIEFTINNDILISAGNDRKIIIWNIKEKKKKEELLGHSYSIKALSISPDQKIFASCDESSFILIWDFKICIRKIDCIVDQNCINPSIGFLNEGKNLIASNSEKIVIFDSEKNWENLMEFPIENINTLVTNPFKNSLFAIASGKTIKIYRNYLNVANFPALNSLMEDFSSIIFSPNDNKIISGGNEKVISIWNIKLQEKIKNIYEHKEIIQGLLLVNSSIFISYENYLLIIWNLKNLEVIKKIEMQDEIQRIKLSKEKNMIFILTSYTYLSLNIEKNFELNTEIDKFSTSEIMRDFDYLYSDNNLVAFCGDNQGILIYDNSKKEDVELKILYRGKLTKIIFTPNDEYLIVGSGFGELLLLDSMYLNVLLSYNGHKRRITEIIYDKEGEKFFSSCSEGKIFAWDLLTAQKLIAFIGNTNVNKIILSNNGNLLASCSNDGNIFIWKNFSKECQKSLRKNKLSENEIIIDLAFNNLSNELLTVSNTTNELNLWGEDRVFKKKIEFNFPTNKIFAIKVCPNCLYFALLSITGVFILDFRNFSLKNEWKIPQVTSGSFYDSVVNSKELFFACTKMGLIWMLDLETNKKIQIIYNGLIHNDRITTTICINNLLITAGYDSKLLIWEIPADFTEEILSKTLPPKNLSTDEYFIENCDAHKEKMLLAVPSRNRKINIYNISKYDKVAELEGHLGPVFVTAFDKDCNMLASGDRLGKVFLWDTFSFKKIGMLDFSSSNIINLEFSPAGATLAITGQNDKTILYVNQEQFYKAHLIYHALKNNSIQFLLDQCSSKMELINSIFFHRIFPFKMTLIHVICYFQDANLLKEFFSLVIKYKLPIRMHEDCFGVTAMETSLENIETVKIITNFFIKIEGTSSTISEQILCKLIEKDYPQMAELLDSSLIFVKNAPKTTVKLNDINFFESKSISLSSDDMIKNNFIEKPNENQIKSRINVYYIDIKNFLSFKGAFLSSITDLDSNDPIFQSKVKY